MDMLSDESFKSVDPRTMKADQTGHMVTQINVCTKQICHLADFIVYFLMFSLTDDSTADNKLAVSLQNLYFGYPTRSDTNWAV